MPEPEQLGSSNTNFTFLNLLSPGFVCKKFSLKVLMFCCELYLCTVLFKMLNLLTSFSNASTFLVNSGLKMYSPSWTVLFPGAEHASSTVKSLSWDFCTPCISKNGGMALLKLWMTAMLDCRSMGCYLSKSLYFYEVRSYMLGMRELVRRFCYDLKSVVKAEKESGSDEVYKSGL
jgi:hypothetical protein